MSSTKFTYLTLRYVHDTLTGEFMNVGVVLYAPDADYLGALCRTTYRRLSSTFPGLNGENFRAVMRHVQSRFETLAEKLADQKASVGFESLAQIARSVIPQDDSALQWGPVGAGLAADPSQKLEALFDRLVMRYDDSGPQRLRRSDDDVWRNFKRDLQQRRLLRFFEPKTIAVRDDAVQFEHAWKNGIWHCVEPVSFDLAAAETIRDKAHKLLGQLTSIQNADEHFRLYMLIAKPTDDVLVPAYESALSILAKIPGEKAIFEEDEHAKLADILEEEVRTHKGGQGLLA